MESTTFRNQIMCVLFYYFALHYMFRPTCRPSSGAMWQYYNGQVTEFYSVDPLSHDIIIVLVYYIAKCSMNILRG
jgi:hypothetical protein